MHVHYLDLHHTYTCARTSRNQSPIVPGTANAKPCSNALRMQMSTIPIYQDEPYRYKRFIQLPCTLSYSMNNSSSSLPLRSSLRPFRHSRTARRARCNKVQCAQNNRAQRHVCCSFSTSSSSTASSSSRFTRSLHAPAAQLYSLHIYTCARVRAHPRRRDSYMLALIAR